jgi:hypothetical protein
VRTLEADAALSESCTHAPFDDENCQHICSAITAQAGHAATRESWASPWHPPGAHGRTVRRAECRDAQSQIRHDHGIVTTTGPTAMHSTLLWPPSREPEPGLIRELIAGALELEAGRDAPHPEWRGRNPDRVSAAISAHRLDNVLAGALPRLGAPATVCQTASQRAETNRLRAMPLLAAARDVVRALGDAGIRALVFKGLALAAQTTGDPLGRGVGDLDLLVAPESLPDALAVLGRLGFRPPENMPRRLPAQLDSWAGRYARYGDYEVTLRCGTVYLDLHWAPTDVRSALPTFERLWDARVEVLLSGQLVPTFGLEHALIHACCHAAKDQWRLIRSLVDIERLARLRDSRAADVRPTGLIRRHPAVHRSALVTHACTGGDASRRLAAEALGRRMADGAERALDAAEARQLRRCLAIAERAQSASSEDMDSAAWYLGLWRQSRMVNRTADDWLRDLAVHLLPPVACFDPVSGKARTLHAALWQRLRRVAALARPAPRQAD